LAAAALKMNDDTQRLDWLERTRSEIDTDGPGFIIYNASEELGRGASKGAWKTLREAIDAAMKNQH